LLDLDSMLATGTNTAATTGPTDLLGGDMMGIFGGGGQPDTTA